MNLISKRIGINDHFPYDKYSKVIFKDAMPYEDIIKQADEFQPAKYGICIKNQYRSDDWLKAWIKCDVNKELGKEKSYYVYNVDYDGICKPTKKHTEDNDDAVLYERANGVMYYDFDNIGKGIVEEIKKVFENVSSTYKVFQWFERSWSGKGCHIRINYEMKFNHKSEWQFVYMYYLDVLMKEISKIVDVSTWYNDGTIDWSCATITRGFAIPYNKEGVVENPCFDRKDTIKYKSKDDLCVLANSYVYGYWEKEIANRFLHNIGFKKHKNNQPFVTNYNVDGVKPENAQFVDGEKFNYNWRLKCVTTLMNLCNGDKDLVRESCKYIYSLIKPYKNHTYNEMIGYELEEKIFRNGDMTMSASREIIEDLRHYFGFEISEHLKVNEVYVSDILNKITKI